MNGDEMPADGGEKEAKKAEIILCVNYVLAWYNWQ